MPIPVVVGAAAAAAARLAATAAARKVMLGIGLWWGGNYVFRKAAEEAKDTVTAIGVATGDASEVAAKQFERSARNLIVPMVAGYIAYSIMYPDKKR